MRHSIQLKSLYQPDGQQISAQPLAIALALVKNEASIISYWLSHVYELFDLIYIVDHQSIDGTCEYLLEVAQSTGKIHLCSFEYPGYFQSEIINHLAQSVVQTYPDAWLFPLDADEFLGVTSREEFLTSLASQKAGQILQLNWQNCLPMYMVEDRFLEPNFPCIFSSQGGAYNKVAIQSKTLKDRNLWFTQGNHGLETEAGQLIQEKQVRFVDLYHLPIRSIDHFALKCIQGYIAKISLPPDRDHSGQLVHWKKMIDTVLASGNFEINLLRKFVTSYGQPNNLEITSLYDLLDQGWQVDGFNVATNKDILKHLVSRKYFYLDLTRQALQGYMADPELTAFLRIVEENQHRISNPTTWEQASGKVQIYKELPEVQHHDSKQRTEDSDIKLLNAFFSKAYTPRKNPVPSTWEGHVPFLYCLLDWARPRRFVELGSQYGNCFFAACQTSQALKDTIECIAIDMWIGDEHTGAYRDEVFQFFLHILNIQYPKGKYIRNFFSEAVSQFEDGSIDLLHIDGLHTYAAVAEDYHTWLPKLSDQGIIMFHDTQERDRNFGVWKLWAEVKDKYPSFEFEHGHGLGVILVGTNASSSVQALFEVLTKPDNLHFAQFFFSNLKPVLPG